MSIFGNDILAAANAAPVAQPVTGGLGSDDILAQSGAISTDVALNVPGMARPYLPHQGAAHVACNSAIDRFGCALLGDDMGMGKTQVMMALAAERIDAGGYAIMIAPPVALAGYKSDLAAAFPHLRLSHLRGRKPERECVRCHASMVPGTERYCATDGGDCTPTVRIPEVADVYFLSDDPQSLKAWLVTEHKLISGKVRLEGNAFTTGAAILCRDEIHRDKGQQGQAKGVRAQTMMAVGQALRDAGIPIVGATGTLLTNRPVEGMIPLQILGGEALVLAVTPGAHKPSGFLWRYCAPQQQYIPGRGTVTNFGGVDMAQMANLHEYLRRTVYVRREKSDLGEGVLPHSGWSIVPIALNGVMTRYDRLARDFLNTVLAEEGPDAYWRKARAEVVQQMMALWQEAGRAKAAAACEYVTNLTDQGRQVVVFYHHDAARDALLAALAKDGTSYTVIAGSVTGPAREAAIAEFQRGDAMVMMAQHGAAGIAVTLTAAADACFLQVPWAAGTIKQCADRILRVDDRTRARADAGERVTWHVLQAAYADGTPTFDMAMWDVLERKAAVCDAVNAGKPVTMSDDDIYRAALEAWYPAAQAHYR